ncbi:hypothetical protein N9W29_00330 [Candidatus Pelagibacter bacterium]|nr:hypothetical protein [Candidatus Pelagibacter bacterium]
MPISRSQMPRQMYGLGSFVKSIGKGIKKIVKSPIGKAAILGLGAYGLGGGSFFGKMLPGVTRGGQGIGGFGGLSSIFGNVGDIIGGTSLGDKFAGFATGKTSKAGLGILGASALSGLFAGKSQEEVSDLKQNPAALRGYLSQYYKNLNQSASDTEVNEFVESNMAEYKADGGRIGYAEGSEDIILPMRKPKIEQIMSNNPGAAESGNPITRNNPVADLIDKYNTYKKAMPGVADETKTYLIEDFKQSLENSGISIEEFNMRLQEQNEMNQPVEKAYGGRINRAYGSDDLVEQASGIEGLDINVNPEGVKELDLRDSGGFIPPVGVKEKADDIPAMLSNNEFVFTADAVRGMGNGNVDTGAQRMYDMMKKLENGGRV